ncbi:cytochrome c [Tenacibaculum skagerrakense]|uniref:Cytochrome c n=1 Tax=Tenacibaculum skagerrakense TaxID=186571 RepID=A0A4R2NP65_9FLAO|nr:c-type cytochrome [Tenacibaculum skagerrakense]TCP23599.1 cytochrome c [Tenacibaculum skagerrakense]
MKISANTIFGSIITIILLCMILWMVRIQTKQEYPDVTDKVVKARVMKQSVERGRAIFLDEGCYRCHKPDKRDGFIRGVTSRVSREWLFQFIRDESSLIKGKDSIVLALKELYNWSNGEHDKKHLTNQELTDILNYLDSYK